MPQVVPVSRVEKSEELISYINDLFGNGRYAEITQAIGMHSILIDPENMVRDQNDLYRLVLDLVKRRITRDQPGVYSAWLKGFPATMAELVKTGAAVTDENAHSALASRHAAFGPFTSVDEFFFWALDDRRLTLDQIMRYIDATVRLQKR